MNSLTRLTRSAHQSLSVCLQLIFAVLVLLISAISFQPPAMAGTFNVSDAAGLRAALLTAATNGQDDVIVLAAGTYATSGTAFTFGTNENRTLTLRGADGTTRGQVILDGGSTSQVLKLDCLGNGLCGTVTLRGLTVQNGNANSGGGVSASQALEISDISFSGNRSNGPGGAISGNFMKINSSIFSRNTAGGDGGAIYGYGILTNSLFSNNTAGGGGGAIASFFILVVNSTFSGNSASGHGSAMDIYGSSGDSILNLSFYGYANSLLINSVFYGNPAPAVFIETTNSATLYYNLINTSADVAGAIPQPQSIGNVAPGAISPFVDAANGNFRLAAGSLAINAGLDPNSTTFANLANSSIITSVRQALLTDLDGNPRPTLGTAVDIGAYEFAPDTQAPTVPTGLSATAVSSSQINLAWIASTDNVGVTAYKVYRGGGLIATLGNVTSYSNTGLTASTAYSYTVQACDAAGNCSAQSAPATATTVACAYSLSSNSQSVAANAVIVALGVTAASGCAWTASSNVNWITITSGGSGSGNGTVLYSVADNTNGSPRTGTLTIAGQTFTVAQQGIAVPTCTLTASASTINLGGTVILTATCNPAATSYAWTPATGLVAGTGNTATVTPTAVGVYQYSVTGSNAGGTGNIASTSVTVTAPTFVSRSDCLFNWAERNYPSLFAPAGAGSSTFGPYYFRYYPQTIAYLATSSADNHVYYFGPSSNNTLLDVGALSVWSSTAGCQ